MFFSQHILPLLPLYNAQWWGYELLTAIVLVVTVLYFIKNMNITEVIFGGLLAVYLSLSHGP